MKQKDNKQMKESIITAIDPIPNSSDRAVKDPFNKERDTIQQNESIKKAVELFALYYDEFHFANYE